MAPEYTTNTTFRLYRIDENGLLKRPMTSGYGQPEPLFEDGTKKEIKAQLTKKRYFSDVVILPITRLYQN